MKRKTGRELKKEGMARAEKHAPKGWMDLATRAIRKVCVKREFFTADDVWLSGVPMPHEGRALGAAVSAALKLGYCEPTIHHVRTIQAKSHAAPIRVWRSALFRGKRFRGRLSPRTLARLLRERRKRSRSPIAKRIVAKIGRALSKPRRVAEAKRKRVARHAR